MADNKRFKLIQPALESVTIGSLSAVSADDVSVLARCSRSGVQFCSMTNSTGSAEVSIQTEDANVSGTPGVAFVGGMYRTTLPTYTDGDAGVLHFDASGRLLVTQGSSSQTPAEETDNSPAPANPIGAYVLAKYEATQSTYADGDAAVIHSDSRGRLLVALGDGATAISIGTDDSAAPTNPIGQFVMGHYEATPSTYTDGDAAALHADVNGRLSTDSYQTPAATGTTANVTASASNVTLQAANTSRLGWVIHNDSSATLYAKFGATASLTSYSVKIGPDTFYELHYRYTGIIDGVWDSATGTARVTELT